MYNGLELQHVAEMLKLRMPASDTCFEAACYFTKGFDDAISAGRRAAAHADAGNFCHWYA